MDIKKIIKELSDSVCIGHIDDALLLAEGMLPDNCEIKRLYGNSLSAFIKGKSDYTIALEAHIDEIGFVVTDVDGGFLKVAAAGGFDLRTLPSHRVTVHGKEKVDAVFTSIPPHLAKDDAEFEDLSQLSIDTGLDCAKDLVTVGDFVTYSAKCENLQGNRITGKSLDDRAGVATLIYLANMIKETPPVNVLILICNAEELGTRGAKTAAFECEFDEAVAIDVSFASYPGVKPEECGKLSDGPMIGQSPILSRKVVNGLVTAAEKDAIPYQLETMGGNTSTDADVITVTKHGIPTGLVSIPLRNMHTDTEVIDTDDVLAVSKLLYSYILAGGIKNA